MMDIIHHGIDEHLVQYNMRILLSDFICYFIPQHHPGPLGIGLGDESKLFSRLLFCDLEGETKDAANGVSAEDGEFFGCESIV